VIGRSGKPPEAGHGHVTVPPRTVLPRSVLAFLIIIGVGLAFSIAVSYSAATRANQQAEQSKQDTAAVDRRLQALEDYVAGKGAQRDADTQRLHQQITDAVCSVLEQLPAGNLLDQVRAEYGCGPGVPPTPSP